MIEPVPSCLLIIIVAVYRCCTRVQETRRKTTLPLFGIIWVTNEVCKRKKEENEF